MHVAALTKINPEATTANNSNSNGNNHQPSTMPTTEHDDYQLASKRC
jgi:hypothetical protein